MTDRIAAPDRRVVGALLVGIVLLGGALRLYRLDALSLWLDEGFSVLFTRHSWPVVLGLQGAYDFHPPLYFSLAKLAGLMLPEVDAVRGVSWLAGTLTLPVVFALGARLLDTRAGLIAALALAVSPPHLWFSQEGRPFAATTLAVAVSYLALVGFYQTARWGWAVSYGAAVTTVPAPSASTVAAANAPRRARTTAPSAPPSDHIASSGRWATGHCSHGVERVLV
jgi:4-amino-4-deoxy-L-arabinose transferase-like glycosyltransferase